MQEKTPLPDSIHESPHRGTPRAPTRAAQDFGLIPGYGRDVSQQSARVGNHGRGIKSAGRFSGPALRKSFHLALQLSAGARRAPGLLLAHDKTLKSVMALLAHIFKNRHGLFQ